jgi:hypothetical protein
VFWKTSGMPGMIGVAVGAIGDPAYPRPTRSLWERSMHAWVATDGPVERFSRGLRG